jgi:hypothetical protein
MGELGAEVKVEVREAEEKGHGGWELGRWAVGR